MTPLKLPLVPDFELFRSPDSDQFLLLPNTRYARDWVKAAVEVPHWRGSCLVYGESDVLNMVTAAAKAGLIVSSVALTYRLLLSVVQEAEGRTPRPINFSFTPVFQVEVPAPNESVSPANCEPDPADEYRLSGLGVKWDAGDS